MTAPPNLIIDSDVFALLAAAGALQDAIVALGTRPEQCRRLHPLPWMVRRGKFEQLSAKALGEEDSRTAVARVLAECDRIAPLEERAGPPQELVGLIDPGELQALAFLIGAPGVKFLSNDQRWMHTVCNDERSAGIRLAIAGRIVCLETVLALVLDGWGVQRLARAFSPFTGHRHLKVYFSAGLQTTEAHLREALSSYFRSRQTELGGDFLYEAPGGSR